MDVQGGLMISRNGKFVAIDCKFLEIEEAREKSRDKEADFRHLCMVTPRMQHLRVLWVLYDLRNRAITKGRFLRICEEIADGA